MRTDCDQQRSVYPPDWPDDAAIIRLVGGDGGVLLWRSVVWRRSEVFRQRMVSLGEERLDQRPNTQHCY